MRNHALHALTLAVLAAGTGVAPLAAQSVAQRPAAAAQRAPAPTATPAKASAPTLELAEVYQLARARSPRLTAASALVDARRSMERSAGLPSDPSLQIGVMNFSVPEFDTSMPTSMTPSIQLMQMVPLPGKLGLSERIARQSTEQARRDADEAAWEVRASAAMAYYMVFEAERQSDVMRETLRWLQDFEQVAKAMYASGAGRQSDVLRAGVEVSRMEAELRRMTAMRQSAVARLNGVLNRAADSDVARTALPALPAALPALDTLRAWALESRPMLERARVGIRQAETRGELARRELWPDPVIGVEYGQRRTAGDEMTPAGTERMASLMVGFSLPVFAGARQLRMRDEAAAMASMARADLAMMQAGIEARLGELLATLDRSRTLVTLYRTDVLPQARMNAESSMASYRAGTVDFMTLVDAQMSLSRYEQELYTLLAEYGRSVAELEMTIGRELPVAAATVAEE